MDENTSTDEAVEQITDQPDQPEEPAVDETPDEQSTEHEPETFPREYVQKLQDQSAKYRTRAQQTDAIAQRLHSAW